MAKTTASASAAAAADLATAAEVTGGGVDIEKLQDGQNAAITDAGPVQGEAVAAQAPRETIEYPYYAKDGSKIGECLIVRY